MVKKDFNTEFDGLIREALKTEDKPDVRLNNGLKAELYERERFQRQSAEGKGISLWYLPMVLNLIIFILLGAALVLLINNLYLAVLAASACAYMGIAGVVITLVGIKRTDLREDISVCIKKGDHGYEKA